ncbi:hypothetical protein LTR78_002451 [Recurvomyces mirabilis]|uniref:DUF7707 domain-containing protein n=1 Tax=Recurvomyces mirabilis TaxID=574656 RepID=A0AAE0WT26_9PEZI|nr:hypothetical protein LTR78_002451 [Recurvomyces mirabilis]KAK5157380.1 hypothetical protein LTS14_004145 [Recurvomyces mirabilis]
MFYSTLLLAVTAFTGLVSAQNYSTSGALSIDVSQVDTQQRLAWCVSQTTSCPQICSGSTTANTCDSNTLNYTCTCSGGSSPNISDYTQTVPFFVCEQWKANCADAHPNDLQGLAGCHSVVCGAKNASAAGGSSGSSSASSGSASATGSSTGSATGAAGSASATGSAAASAASSGAASATSSAAAASSSAASAAVGLAMQYSSGILAAAMLAVFGLAL